MSADVVLLVATAVLAVVALVAAVVAVVAVRRLARMQGTGPVPAAVPRETGAPAAASPAPEPPVTTATTAPSSSPELEGRQVDVTATPQRVVGRVVEGRVVVEPTAAQVVATAMSRPQVRLSVWAHGLAHALRPESRDRIGALVRREYRGRRRARLAAGRRAVRAAHPTPPADRWLGDS